jgi:hypothetical protein
MHICMSICIYVYTCSNMYRLGLQSLFFNIFHSHTTLKGASRCIGAAMGCSKQVEHSSRKAFVATGAYLIVGRSQVKFCVTSSHGSKFKLY